MAKKIEQRVEVIHTGDEDNFPYSVSQSYVNGIHFNKIKIRTMTNLPNGDSYSSLALFQSNHGTVIDGYLSEVPQSPSFIEIALTVTFKADSNNPETYLFKGATKSAVMALALSHAEGIEHTDLIIHATTKITYED